MSSRIAVYPGTFDPLTRGHEDLVRRACGLFEHVIVGIARSPSKKPCFELEDRVDMAREVLAPFKNASVAGFGGLLMGFVREQGATVIIRGLRAVSDFDYEFQMAGMNHRLDPAIETVFLMASETHQFIASRLVKEIARMGGDISSFVPGLTFDRTMARVRR